MREISRVFWVVVLAAGFCGCASQRMRCMPRETEEECKGRIRCPAEWTMEKCRQVVRDAGCDESMTIRKCDEKLVEAILSK